MQINFNLISFTLSFVSLFVSFFAVIQAWMIKREADKVNRETTQILIDIRSDAKAISSYAIPELRRYGETSRQVMLGSMSNTQGSLQMSAPVSTIVGSSGGSVGETADENEGRSDEIHR